MTDVLANMISVVIPTRHRNDPLAECLARLAPGVQTLAADRYEVIVTDDGSAETSADVVRQRFPWARWAAGPRRGPAANRNNGARQARGQWLAFTDDDCLPSPKWLSAYTAATEQGTAVYEGRTTCAAGLTSILQEAPINSDGGHLWSCNMMLSAATFHVLGEFDERFPHASAEDIEFHGRIRRAGLSVRFVPEAVVDHPPRPRRQGAVAASLWESRVLLRRLHPETLREPLPWHVAKVRLAQFLQSATPSADWLRFARSSLIEVAVVAARTRTWESRYAGVKPQPSASTPTSPEHPAQK